MRQEFHRGRLWEGSESMNMIRKGRLKISWNRRAGQAKLSARVGPRTKSRWRISRLKYIFAKENQILQPVEPTRVARYARLQSLVPRSFSLFHS